MVMCPKVSVIVPNYNYERYLKARIESILRQTFGDFELILLDDASTDGSVSVMESYRDNPHVTHIVVNSHNTGSPFTQWQKGIDLARGEYVWIAESDDLASPFFLERTVAALDGNPQTRICTTGSVIVDSEGNRLKESGFYLWPDDGTAHVYDSRWYLRHKMFKGNKVYNASMVLFRRAGCMDRYPEFVSMRYCGDWLFWAGQMQDSEAVVEIHSYLNSFRQHPVSTTRQSAHDFRGYREYMTVKKRFYAGIVQDPLAIKWDMCQCYRGVKNEPAGRTHRRKLHAILKESLGMTWLKYAVWKPVLSVFRAIPSVKERML